MSDYKEYDPSVTSRVRDGGPSAPGRAERRAEVTVNLIIAAFFAAFVGALVWGGFDARARNVQGDDAFTAWCADSAGVVEPDGSRVPVSERLDGARVGYCIVDGRVVGAR